MQAPQKRETPLAGGDFAEETKVQAPIIAAEPGADKAFCNLRAMLALKGHSLTRTDRADGVVTYHASRWGLVRALGNLDEVQAFLVQIGGAA